MTSETESRVNSLASDSEKEPKPRNHQRRGRRSSDAHIPKIDRILIDVQRRLRDSVERVVLEGLNSFERKRIHRFFDRFPGVETRTIRNGEDYNLHVIPVGNVKKLAHEKADEALQTGQTVSLPPMDSYERFIVHTELKEVEGIETESSGEGAGRHVEIRPRRFGRSLRKIIKKIRIF